MIKNQINRTVKKEANLTLKSPGETHCICKSSAVPSCETEPTVAYGKNQPVSLALLKSHLNKEKTLLGYCYIVFERFFLSKGLGCLFFFFLWVYFLLKEPKYPACWRNRAGDHMPNYEQPYIYSPTLFSQFSLQQETVPELLTLRVQIHEQQPKRPNISVLL